MAILQPTGEERPHELPQLLEDSPSNGTFTDAKSFKRRKRTIFEWVYLTSSV
jgi:hypothetical protein